MAEGNCFRLSMYFKTAIFKIWHILPIISLFWSKNHTLFQNKIDRKDKLTRNSHNPPPTDHTFFHLLESENPTLEKFTMSNASLNTNRQNLLKGFYDSWMEGSLLLDFPPPPQVLGGQSIWEVLPSESNASANKTACVPGKGDKWKEKI